MWRRLKFWSVRVRVSSTYLEIYNDDIHMIKMKKICLMFPISDSFFISLTLSLFIIIIIIRHYHYYQYHDL